MDICSTDMMISESSRYLRSVLLLTSLLAVTQCQYDDDSSDNGSSSDDKQYHQELGRILFKHMRFRDLPEFAEAYESPAYTSWQDGNSYGDARSRLDAGTKFLRDLREDPSALWPRRERKSSLVSNLAAVLTDINKNSKSSAQSMRMPSLRFG